MSLFQCENCGCCENTALSSQGIGKWKRIQEHFDWTGLEDRKGKLLCSACSPNKHSDGEPTRFIGWHGRFDQTFLPMGEFKTNKVGNLEHIETGSEDFMTFAIPPSTPADPE